MKTYTEFLNEGQRFLRSIPAGGLQRVPDADGVEDILNELDKSNAEVSDLNNLLQESDFGTVWRIGTVSEIEERIIKVDGLKNEDAAYDINSCNEECRLNLTLPNGIRYVANVDTTYREINNDVSCVESPVDINDYEEQITFKVTFYVNATLKSNFAGKILLKDDNCDVMTQFKTGDEIDLCVDVNAAIVKEKDDTITIYYYYQKGYDWQYGPIYDAKQNDYIVNKLFSQFDYDEIVYKVPN